MVLNISAILRDLLIRIDIQDQGVISKLDNINSKIDDTRKNFQILSNQFKYLEQIKREITTGVIPQAVATTTGVQQPATEQPVAEILRLGLSTKDIPGRSFVQKTRGEIREAEVATIFGEDPKQFVQLTENLTKQIKRMFPNFENMNLAFGKLNQNIQTAVHETSGQAEQQKMIKEWEAELTKLKEIEVKQQKEIVSEQTQQVQKQKKMTALEVVGEEIFEREMKSVIGGKGETGKLGIWLSALKTKHKPLDPEEFTARAYESVIERLSSEYEKIRSELASKESKGTEQEALQYQQYITSRTGNIILDVASEYLKALGGKPERTPEVPEETAPKIDPRQKELKRLKEQYEKIKQMKPGTKISTQTLMKAGELKKQMKILREEIQPTEESATGQNQIIVNNNIGNAYPKTVVKSITQGAFRGLNILSIEGK